MPNILKDDTIQKTQEILPQKLEQIYEIYEFSNMTEYKVTTKQPAAPRGRVVHCQSQRKPLPQILAPTHFPIPKKPFLHPWKKGQMATCNISILKHMLVSRLPQYKSLSQPGFIQPPSTNPTPMSSFWASPSLSFPYNPAIQAMLFLPLMGPSPFSAPCLPLLLCPISLFMTIFSPLAMFTLLYSLPTPPLISIIKISSTIPWRVMYFIQYISLISALGRQR